MPKLFTLLKSRMFWAAIIGLLFMVVKAFYPAFPLEEDQVTNLVMVLVAYILGEAVEGGGFQAARLLEVFKSRKFWGAVVGLFFVLLQGLDPDFPLDQAAVTNLVYVLVAYIFGTGVKDRLDAKTALPLGS
ncbi:MAG: hypothetical protein VB089_06090 [Anaerolineaceae bacterium]|jgi:uncharacterized membrane protein|nr:hypothetical protein [Anaerolineaceae bacterium]